MIRIHILCELRCIEAVFLNNIIHSLDLYNSRDHKFRTNVTNISNCYLCIVSLVESGEISEDRVEIISQARLSTAQEILNNKSWL